MAVQQASEHAMARSVALALAKVIDSATMPDPDVTMDPALIEAEDTLSEFNWDGPIAGSKCLYATSLRTGERFRIVVKPLRAGESSDD